MNQRRPKTGAVLLEDGKRLKDYAVGDHDVIFARNCASTCEASGLLGMFVYTLCTAGWGVLVLQLCDGSIESECTGAAAGSFVGCIVAGIAVVGFIAKCNEHEPMFQEEQPSRTRSSGES